MYCDNYGTVVFDFDHVSSDLHIIRGLLFCNLIRVHKTSENIVLALIALR